MKHFGRSRLEKFATVISAKIPQTLVAQRIEGRKICNTFATRSPEIARKYPKIPQAERLFSSRKRQRKNLGTIVIPRFLDGARYRTRTCDPMHVKHVVAVATKRWYKRDCGLFSSAWCHAGATHNIKTRLRRTRKGARRQQLSYTFPFTF